jgi:hypothetical protein
MTTAERLSRGIHRLGLLLAMLAFLGVTLAGLVDVTERDVPMLATLAVYILYAVIVGIFVYGIVRAIGWVIRGFTAT